MYCRSLITVFLRENVGTVISEILFFINPLKKIFTPRVYLRIILSRYFLHHANILYERAHINLMFHALSLHRSNTVFSRHREKCVTKTWRSSLANVTRQICYCSSTAFLLLRMARCKFSERRETEERSFSRAERSQWEARASHLF